MTTAADSFGSSVESTLSFADEPNAVLRARITQALRYTFSWQEALQESASSPAYIIGDPTGEEIDPLITRVADMQTRLSQLLDLVPLSDVFPGKDAAAAYERTSADFAQLYRDLSLSLATLPQRALLDQLGDLGSAALRAPVAAGKAIAEQIAQAIRELLGNTAAAIWSALWPVILIGGAVGVGYLFRAPLARALGKVTK